MTLKGPPQALMINEPDTLEINICTGDNDPGMAIFVSDSTMQGDHQGLAFCGLALTPHQAIAMLDALRQGEGDMRRAIASGHGGRSGHVIVNRR